MANEEFKSNQTNILHDPGARDILCEYQGLKMDRKQIWNIW